jgi:serine/threonine protein kinase
MSETEDKIRSALGNKYEIRELIAEGGMGQIYLGIHQSLCKKVAIKIIHQELTKDKKLRERFRREAKSAAKLHHPGIIDIYDFGSKDGFDFLIMPYIEGITLKEKLLKEGKTELKECLRLMIAVADALAYAHENEVIHRDIKPANIMIDRQHNVIITDFGISKDLGSSDSALTAVGMMVGSPRYMSPEQIKSLPSDKRSDIYSLGIVFYEMVTGRHPFEGKDMFAFYHAHVSEIPPRPPGVPEPVVDIIMKMVEKAPENRFQNSRQLLKSLIRSRSELLRETGTYDNPSEIPSETDDDDTVQIMRTLTEASPATESHGSDTSEKSKSDDDSTIVFTRNAADDVTKADSEVSEVRSALPKSKADEETAVVKKTGGNDELTRMVIPDVSGKFSKKWIIPIVATIFLFIAGLIVFFLVSKDSVPPPDNSLKPLQQPVPPPENPVQPQESPEQRKKHIKELLESGNEAWEANDPEKAKIIFNKVLQDDPANFVATQALGRIKESEEQKENEQQISDLIASGNASLDQGHLDQAKGFFEKVLEISAENPSAKDLLGQVGRKYAEQGERAMNEGNCLEAEKAFQAALDILSDDAKIKESLSIAKEAKGTLNIIHCEPKADIFIDGKDMKRKTPAKDIRLACGKHEIKLVSTNNSEYRTRTSEIHIKVNKITKLIVIGNGIQAIND